MKVSNVATTILKQLGGNRFIAMTGSKNLIDVKVGLTMQLTRNNLKAKYLKIELTSMDDYTLTFTKVNRNHDLINIKTIEGVYCDQLQSVFTEQTGLYTSL